jgi:hypothetical protein
MSAQRRFSTLLMVQRRRVDQALTRLQDLNVVQRQRELEREEAFENWEDSCAAYRLEQSRLAEEIATNIGSGTRVSRFTGASARCEAGRVRLAQMVRALELAEANLASAGVAATEARALYRRSAARQDGLLKLAGSWSAAERKREARLEEQGA